MRESWTCVRTRSSAWPPMDASLHGTTKPRGGAPSTVSPISVGEHCASIATIDFTAPDKASAAEPIRRSRRRCNSRAAASEQRRLRWPGEHDWRLAEVRNQPLHHRKPLVALPLVRRSAAPIGDDADRRADTAREVGASLETACESRRSLPPAGCPAPCPPPRPAASSRMMTRRTRSLRASAWAHAPPSSPAPMMQTVDTSQWSILVDGSRFSTSDFSLPNRVQVQGGVTGLMSSLTGKVAFVTGGSRGIGLAISEGTGGQRCRRSRSREPIRAARLRGGGAGQRTRSAFAPTCGICGRRGALSRRPCPSSAVSTSSSTTPASACFARWPRWPSTSGTGSSTRT